MITLTLFILAASHLAQPQTASQLSHLSVRHSRQQLVVIDNGSRHLLQVDGKIDAAKLEEVKLLFASRLGMNLYLVVDLRGWSKAKQDDRQCGAGEEANLMWISVTSAWRVSKAQSVRYESCWAPIEGEGYEITGQRMKLKYSDFRKNLSFDVEYDADKPGEGFKVSEAKLMEN